MALSIVSLQCPKCATNFHVHVPVIGQLQQRVFLLQRILKHNSIQYYDPDIAETYGRHLDIFIGSEVVSTQDAKYVIEGPIVLEDKTVDMEA